MPKAPSEGLLMRVPAAGPREAFFGAAAADRLLDIQAYMFRVICDQRANMVWLTRESLCMKRCTHASVRRMGLQILFKALSR
jgi:hypothetical protein